MKRRRSRKREAGFSLIETFIASVVLFIALFGLSIIAVAAAINNRQGELPLNAERLAATKLSDYSARGVKTIQSEMVGKPASTTPDWIELDKNDVTDTTGRSLHFLVEASDQSANNNSPTGSGVTMQVRVTVQWVDPLRGLQTQSRNAYVSENGS